ncbi:MAG: single-stranded-DNA-specific exonuclease RecJ [Spirochaetaceae bacterium]|jgi:single-stranded-DNA-specific exonuclease|nr:single-stranded-DNA-specific exonuclease RecJ [Spirochaetaceae bacterium]
MIWDKKEISQETVKSIAARYDCDFLLASILVRREIIEGEDIQYFLEADPGYLRNPFELPDMEDAVDRILAAKDEGEKVLVFGDRDADGITGTALLTGYLRGLGMDVSWRLPSGDDPYGLSLRAVEEFALASGSLIITVDCGISCIAEVAKANDLGIDVIITDHHPPRDTMPEALVIVNPKREDSAYGFQGLSGCSVAYKLVSALRFAQKSSVYGHSICLLDVRPSNDAYVIDMAKMRNLVVVKRLTETVIPGMMSISETRLPAFLEGQQIFAWDAPLQKKMLAKVFGNGIDVYMLDMAEEIGKEIPQTAGKSLLRIRELSKLAKYSDTAPEELDVFINLFTAFIRRREKHFTGEDRADLQLAALGTIADIMPLRDENRIIVRSGVASLQETSRPGIQDLLFKLGLAGRRFSAGEISWQLCPVINAAGRMGSPEKAAALLLSEDPKERNTLADEIIAMNEERKKLGGDMWALVEPRAAESRAEFDGKMVLAYGEDIARGVTGLMANRASGVFKAPAMVVSFSETTATGSLRSARGFNVRSLMEPCADLCIDWGGHNFAAGFSLERSNWDAFRERLKNMARIIELKDEEDEETIVVDAELPPPYLTPDILKLVDRFEPYGEQNGRLVFMTRGIRVVDITFIGKTEIKHVKLTLDTGKYKWPALYWQAAGKVKQEFDLEDQVDLVYTVERNWFNGIETPQLKIIDLRRSDEAAV